MMGIRTHKMIEDAGKVDTGVMSKLNSIPSALKIYFACDEAGGTQVADEVGTRTLASGVTYDTAFDTANAMKISYLAAPTGDAVPQLSASQSAFIFMCLKTTLTPGVSLFQLGTDGASCRLTIGQEACQVEDGDGQLQTNISTNMGNVATNDDIFVAMHVDRERNEVNTFSFNDAGIAGENIGVDISHLIGAFPIGNVLQVSSGIPQQMYGFGLYVLDRPLSIAEQRQAVAHLWTSLRSADKSLPAPLSTKEQ